MKTMLIAASLASAPTVYVEAVDAASDGAVPLRGWIALRLVQEGYTVTPNPDQADIELVVTHDESGWRVHATGTDRVEVKVPPSASGVERLEVLHRAIESIERVAPAEPIDRASEVPPVVRVVPDPSLEADAHDLVTADVLTAALEAGVTVTGEDAKAQRVLCFDREANGQLRIAVDEDAQRCSREAAAAEPVQANDAGRVVALLLAPPPPARAEALEWDETRAPDEGESRGTETSASAPQPATETPSRLENATPAPSATAVWVDTWGGVLGRLRPVDPAVGAGLRIGRVRGIGGRLDVQVWPSRGDGIQIVDIVAAVGPGGRFPIRSWIGLQGWALLGLHAHHYRPVGDEAGTRFDWSLEVPLELFFLVTRGLEIQLGVRAGRSSRSRQHIVDAQEAWTRSEWRVAGTLGLSHGWVLR